MESFANFLYCRFSDSEFSDLEDGGGVGGGGVTGMVRKKKLPIANWQNNDAAMLPGSKLFQCVDLCDERFFDSSSFTVSYE